MGRLGFAEKEVEAEIERQKLHFRPEGLEALVLQTRFTRKEVQLLYRSFKENCPNGIVSLEKFQAIFAHFFYCGDPSAYAELVFNTFDEDGNGEISFEEFVPRPLPTLARHRGAETGVGIRALRLSPARIHHPRRSSTRHQGRVRHGWNRRRPANHQRGRSRSRRRRFHGSHFPTPTLTLGVTSIRLSEA